MRCVAAPQTALACWHRGGAVLFFDHGVRLPKDAKDGREGKLAAFAAFKKCHKIKEVKTLT
jgi:hypothetical protein